VEPIHLRLVAERGIGQVSETEDVI
jgi:hypothetical protein